MPLEGPFAGEFHGRVVERIVLTVEEITLAATTHKPPPAAKKERSYVGSGWHMFIKESSSRREAEIDALIRSGKTPKQALETLLADTSSFYSQCHTNGGVMGWCSKRWREMTEKDKLEYVDRDRQERERMGIKSHVPQRAPNAFNLFTSDIAAGRRQTYPSDLAVRFRSYCNEHPLIEPSKQMSSFWHDGITEEERSAYTKKSHEMRATFRAEREARPPSARPSDDIAADKEDVSHAKEKQASVASPPPPSPPPPSRVYDHHDDYEEPPWRFPPPDGGSPREDEERPSSAPRPPPLAPPPPLALSPRPSTPHLPI